MKKIIFLIVFLGFHDSFSQEYDLKTLNLKGKVKQIIEIEKDDAGSQISKVISDFNIQGFLIQEIKEGNILGQKLTLKSVFTYFDDYKIKSQTNFETSKLVKTLKYEYINGTQIVKYYDNLGKEIKNNLPMVEVTEETENDETIIKEDFNGNNDLVGLYTLEKNAEISIPNMPYKDVVGASIYEYKYDVNLNWTFRQLKEYIAGEEKPFNISKVSRTIQYH